MEVTDRMIYAFAGEPEITATDAHAIKVGLEAVLKVINAPVQEAEKWPRAVDRDSDTWYQHFPGVWSMDAEGCVEDVFTTQRLLDQYGPLKGEGTW